MLEIPWHKLSPDVLQALIEEFINREGTDYGTREFTLAAKVAQVKTQIRSGEVLIVFDEDSETCTLLPKS